MANGVFTVNGDLTLAVGAAVNMREIVLAALEALGIPHCISGSGM